MYLLLHDNKIILFGFLDTMIKKFISSVETLNLCSSCSFSINLRCHRYGRIQVLQKPKIFYVNLKRIFSLSIYQKVGHIGVGYNFYVTFQYGYSDQALRMDLQQELVQLSSTIIGIWVVIGDFNSVLRRGERERLQVTLTKSQEYQKYVGTCLLQDLKSTQGYFTCNNKHSNASKVSIKIDRVLVNGSQLNIPRSIKNYGNVRLPDH